MTLALPRRRRRVRPMVIGRHAFLIAGAFLAAFPFYWMFVLSTQPSNTIFSFPPALVPGGRLPQNIAEIMSKIDLWAAMANTVIVATTVTVVVLILDSLAAFAFAKYGFRGKNVLFGIIMLTFLLPGQLSTIPQFLLMTQIGWVGTLQAVIVPSFANAFGIFWLRQYFASAVHTELLEAARIDGCGFLRQYLHVALPAARPALAFLGIFTFISAWNDFMWPLIVLNNPDQLTLQVVLSQLQTAHGTDYGMLMAAALISVLPLILVFFLGAKHFLAGITEGAVK